MIYIVENIVIDMVKASIKQIDLDIVPLSKVHNISVSMTIPFGGVSAECVSILWGNNPCESDNGRCNTLHTGSEEAAIAFALYKLIQDKLCGSPLEVARCKVDHVSCKAHDGAFVISWNTQGSGSALRKTLGVALKCLAPNTLYTRYGYNIKNLGGRCDRSVFNHLANKMIEAINKQVHFVVIGKLKADIDAKGLLSTAANKFVASSKNASGDCSAPDKHTDHKHDYAKLSCSDGAAAIVVADYIQHQGFGLRIYGKHIFIYSSSWGSKHDALKKRDRIKSYVAAKYDRLGDLAGLFLAYSANASAMGTGSAILNVAKKIKPSDIISNNL